MTREEALFELGENFNDKELGFVNNIQLICKIFNDHETAIEILMKANEEEISRHFNECEKYEAKLKAKDDEIERLKEIINASIEEIEYALIKPQYAEVYLNNAIRFLKDNA